MSPQTLGRLRIGVLLLAALLLQTSVGANLRVAGVAPDFMVLLTVCAGLTGGAKQGLLVGFWAGLLDDLFLSATPLGLSALVFCLVGYLVGSARAYALSESKLVAPPVALAGTGIAVVVFLLVGALVGQTQLVAAGHVYLVKATVIESVWSAVLAIPAVWLFERAARGTSGAGDLVRGRPDEAMSR